MPASIAQAVAQAFVAAINRRNPDEIANLMTDDHVFVDSLGVRVTGREQMKKGWQCYFAMVPDYTIAIDEIFADGPVVVMLGAAQGAFSSGGSSGGPL
ncbi:MAG: nuclear transport factor 2 family protein, partial [Bryobacteraceae bacterium]